MSDGSKVVMRFNPDGPAGKIHTAVRHGECHATRDTAVLAKPVGAELVRAGHHFRLDIISEFGDGGEAVRVEYENPQTQLELEHAEPPECCDKTST